MSTPNIAPDHQPDDLIRDDRGRHPLVAELEHLRDELAEARSKIENLEIALASSREIGAAIGVVMVTRHVTADEAFGLLREVSQNTHRKLRDVAADVVYTGALDRPEPPDQKGADSTPA